VYFVASWRKNKNCEGMHSFFLNTLYGQKFSEDFRMIFKIKQLSICQILKQMLFDFLPQQLVTINALAASV
jgi:hypothetical protein